MTPEEHRAMLRLLRAAVDYTAEMAAQNPTAVEFNREEFVEDTFQQVLQITETVEIK